MYIWCIYISCKCLVTWEARRGSDPLELKFQWWWATEGGLGIDPRCLESTARALTIEPSLQPFIAVPFQKLFILCISHSFPSLLFTSSLPHLPSIPSIHFSFVSIHKWLDLPWESTKPSTIHLYFAQSFLGMFICTTRVVSHLATLAFKESVSSDINHYGRS